MAAAASVISAGERSLFSSTVKRDAATGFITLSERSVLEGATMLATVRR
jgi:hypothetical protein